jgi:hypothetical protein
LKRNSVPYIFHQTIIQTAFSHACSAFESSVKNRCRCVLTKTTSADNVTGMVRASLGNGHRKHCSCTVGRVCCGRCLATPMFTLPSNGSTRHIASSLRLFVPNRLCITCSSFLMVPARGVFLC